MGFPLPDWLFQPPPPPPPDELPPWAPTLWGGLGSLASLFLTPALHSFPLEWGCWALESMGLTLGALGLHKLILVCMDQWRWLNDRHALRQYREYIRRERGGL